MRREPRRLQIGFALCNLIGQSAIELSERIRPIRLHAEQLRQPRSLRGIAALLQRQLPRHKIQRVDRDPQLERIVSADFQRDRDGRP